jgi:hypothetical protein
MLLTTAEICLGLGCPNAAVVAAAVYANGERKIFLVVLFNCFHFSNNLV